MKKDSTNIVRTYINRAKERGATKEEIDILFEAYLLEHKYNLSCNQDDSNCEKYREACTLIFFGYDDAKKIFDIIKDVISTYGWLTIHEYYEILDVKIHNTDSAEWKKDMHYGWGRKDIEHMVIKPYKQSNNEFIIELPLAEKIF